MTIVEWIRHVKTAGSSAMTELKPPKQISIKNNIPLKGLYISNDMFGY